MPDRAGPADLWRRLGLEQRLAAVGSLLLVVSTFGPFSFVEAAIVLTGLSVLALLRQRAVGKRFHLPLGDGTVVLAAGIWAALLIVVRLLDRPLGQNLLALACAAILVLAGLRERTRRPADDLPFSSKEDDFPEPTTRAAPRASRPGPGGAVVPSPEAPPEFSPEDRTGVVPGEEPTRHLPRD